MNNTLLSACLLSLIVAIGSIYRPSTITMTTAAIRRLPVYSLSHGSPMSLYDPEHPAFKHWQSLGKRIRALQPKAIVIVSAHWQAEQSPLHLRGREPFVEINTNPSNPLIYDFYGFPKHYYDAKFTSHNPSSLFSTVSEELSKNGVQIRQTDRGIDHGVWVPLKSMFGEKLDIPLVQVSLPVERDPLTDGEASLQLGKALRGLREQGVVVIGSGQAVHNLRDWRAGARSPYNKTFPPALEEVFKAHNGSSSNDEQEPVRWQKAKALFERTDYLGAHPTQEHFLPLLVAMGAAHDDEPGVKDFTLDESALVWDMYRIGDEEAAKA